MRPLSTIFLIFFTLFFSLFVEARFLIRPSDQAVFHNNRGVTYLNQGDMENALFEFKMAVQLAPEYAEGYNNLGLTYKFKKQFDLAIDALRKAIQYNKDYAAAYTHLGTVYYTLGKYDEAIAQFHRAIKANKKPSAKVRKVKSCNKMGNAKSRTLRVRHNPPPGGNS